MRRTFPDQRDEIWSVHRTMFMGERYAYYRRRKHSYVDASVWSFITDGMDQKHCRLPHRGTLGGNFFHFLTSYFLIMSIQSSTIVYPSIFKGYCSMDMTFSCTGRSLYMISNIASLFVNNSFNFSGFRTFHNLQNCSSLMAYTFLLQLGTLFK